MRIVIGEDEILIAEHLADIVRSFNYKVVGIGHSKSDIIELLENTRPDLALLDIRMEDEFDGIDIGEYVKQNLGIPFIYITAHSDKEIIEKALPTKPSGYIIKPFKPMDVYTAISIASDQFRKVSGHNYLMVKDGYKKVKVYLYNILFLKSDNNYLEVHTKNKVYILRQSLEKTAEQLSDDHFVRIHRSYLVNLKMITSIDSHFVTLGFRKTPISRSYYNEVLAQFNQL